MFLSIIFVNYINIVYVSSTSIIIHKTMYNAFGFQGKQFLAKIALIFIKIEKKLSEIRACMFCSV